MADIDLYRDAYRTKLGREASDDELQGWTSGAFGGGSVQDRLNQIANSGEAQAYRPQTTSTPILGPSFGENHTLNQPSGVDPNYANTLGQAYQSYTGRSATPEELSNWWSGAFGYGSGWDALNKQIEAIRNSGEAKSRNNGVAPNADRQTIEYWQGQGVNPSDIFNTATGQTNPGWERYGGGYRRTTGGTPTTGGGDLQAWLMAQLTGASSPQALAALEGQLNQRGIRLQKDSAGNVRGRLYLPDGKTVDVVNQWGQPWTWIDRGLGAGDHGGGGQAGGGLPQFNIPGNQYNDPYTQMLEEMMRGRIGQLQGGQDQGYQQLMSYLQQRFQDLQGPGRTGAENEVVRTQALDPIERDRSAAKKRMLERISARGLTPDSGIAQQLLQEVDRAFDEMRATSQTALTVDELNRREGRNQYAENLAGQLYGIPQARSREALGYAGALSDLGPQRLQLAMQAAGLGGNPSSMFQNLIQLAGLNQQSALYDAQNQGNLARQVGEALYYLSRAGI